MGFQVREPNSFSTDRSTMHILEGTRARLSESLQKVLAPGNVLDVTVRRNPEGQSGIYYRGQFIEATMPQTLKDGSRILVMVQSADDSIMLKVISGNNSHKAPMSTADNVRQLISTMFSEGSIKGLQQSARPLSELFQFLGNSSLDPKSSDSLQNLMGKFMASADNLANPKDLQKLLLEMNQTRVLNTTIEAKDALLKLAAVSEATFLNSTSSSLLATIEAQLKSIVGSKGALSFDFASSAGLLKGNLAALRYSLENTTPAQHNPLLSLLNGLSSIDLTQFQGQSGIERTLSDFISFLRHELQHLRESGANSSQIKESLNNALSILRDQFSSQLTDGSQSKNKNQVNMIQAIENIARGQEALNLLNPLMQSLGEPALILIPSFISNMLSRWEMSVLPRQKDSKKQSDKTDVDEYERVRLFLNFPSLGNVQVDLAHKPEEILLNLTFSNDNLASFVAEKIPEIQKIFKSLGYTESKVSSKAGTPHSITPGWYKELAKNCIVA